MDFFIGNHKNFTKSQDFWFADFFLEILKILWIFGCFESVSSRFYFKLLLILNLTNAVLSKTTFRSIFVLQDDVLCAKEIHRLGPVDLKIYTLAKNPRLHVTRKLTKSIDFHQDYLCDFHLWTKLQIYLTTA